ncbi:MAG: PQQ-dependent sugar dehydrogenase [candidate division WOR-3 bacterium]
MNLILNILIFLKIEIGEVPQNVQDKFIPEPNLKVEIWVKNLEIPWSLIFLEDEKALVSERPGRIRLIEKGILKDKPIKVIKEVHHSGEGGLMGLEKHPDFTEKPYIYAMYTYREKGEIKNKVVRFIFYKDSLNFDKVIIDEIPGGKFHNGGRLKFGPDKMLYITTGETFKREIAQDLKNLGGKILRLTPEGEIPPDNPFKNSPIYSYGHRNPQGLAFYPESGELFASEHGPSGEDGVYAHDEVNIIYKGGNYGWPLFVGKLSKKGYIDPLILWKRTTPPAGMCFYKNFLFIATLRSEALIKIEIKKIEDSFKVINIERLFAEDYFNGKYGRLRDVVYHNGYLYVLTSNRDGRGKIKEGDDKILKIKIE